MYGAALTPSTFEAVAGLRRQAADNGWTVPGAALRFILDAPGDLSLIIAPRSVEQFQAYGFPD
jgi:aryl-alcohol dehydrogenase-like predicted oxidoreductase